MDFFVYKDAPQERRAKLVTTPVDLGPLLEQARNEIAEMERGIRDTDAGTDPILRHNPDAERVRANYEQQNETARAVFNLLEQLRARYAQADIFRLVEAASDPFVTWIEARKRTALLLLELGKWHVDERRAEANLALGYAKETMRRIVSLMADGYVRAMHAEQPEEYRILELEVAGERAMEDLMDPDSQDIDDPEQDFSEFEPGSYEDQVARESAKLEAVIADVVIYASDRLVHDGTQRINDFIRQLLQLENGDSE